MNLNDSESTDGKISMLLNALGGDFTRVKCVQCGELDFLVPLDEAFDEGFLANYHCDKCDDLQKVVNPESVSEL